MDLDPKSVEHEMGFWRQFVRTPRFQQWVAPITTPELNKHVQAMLRMYLSMRTQKKAATVLDVGSGPVSILNGFAPGNLDITTCDPLSEHYQSIFDYNKYEITPPLPYPAEEAFQGKTYDVVHISNALDHTVDPAKSLVDLVQCVKEGGYLIVQGFTNEATHENYRGFHQHNLCLIDGQLSISGLLVDSRHLNCHLVFADQDLIQATGREWFIWVLRKNVTSGS